MHFLKIVSATAFSALVTLPMTALSADEEQMSVEELLFDWDALVGQEVSFGGFVGGIELSDKRIIIDQNPFHQMDISNLERKELFYIAEHNSDYWFWMDAAGKPGPEDEFGLMRVFHPREVKFFSAIGVAVSEEGVGMMAYGGADSAENALKEELQNEDQHNVSCCATIEQWISVSDLVKGPMYLAAYFLEGSESYEINMHVARTMAEAKKIALANCEDTRSKSNALERLAFDCQELFMERVFD